MILNSAAALHLCASLVGLSLFIQSRELWLLRPKFSPSGPWAWSFLREDFFVLPKFCLRILDFFYSEANFCGLLMVQAIGAALLPFFPVAPLIVFLFLSSLLCSLRFRGNFNGGADAMTLILLSALSVAAVFRNVASVGHAALVYIAVQSLLSYFIAGCIKLRRANWRRGQTLRNYLAESAYDIPHWLRRFAQMKKNLGLWTCSWLLIIFELMSGYLAFRPHLWPFWMGAAVIFHLTTFMVLGLNRFVFAWMASYPALIYFFQL